jgi:AcrR family transcriptional regulator
MVVKVKTKPARRTYDATRRRAAALRTRTTILEAAKAMFVERGYAGTTMAAIAKAAGVSHETVYASFGPKPALFKYLVEVALSLAEVPVPALERQWVKEVGAEPDPDRKIEMFAHAITAMHERLAPLFLVLVEGARTDPELNTYAEELRRRRATHMRVFAADLCAAGGLREGLSVETAGDVIYALNASEFFMLFVRERGWDPESFEKWVADALKRLLVRD